MLETPNPGNIAVGASSFHMDPTHVKPIPYQLLRFFVEARGFFDVQVREIHPFPAIALVPDDSPAARRLNECFYGPQDYCLTARRP
jgi:hypothetical protein